MHATILIIGGGPAGYLAAERAGARLRAGETIAGTSSAGDDAGVVLVEQDQIGGVCLNAGCVPTKTLLHSAKLYEQARHGERFGVTASEVRYDLQAAMAWKRTVIETLQKGIKASLKKYGVTVITGRAELVDRSTVQVGDQQITADRIIIATGSSSTRPPIPGLDGERVVTSTELLQITDLPKRLAIIGGGYIGMEFASYFSAIGTEVHVIEMMDEIIPFMDAELSKTLRTSMKEVTYHLGCKVERVDDGAVHFTSTGSAGEVDAADSVEADLVLVAIGRRPNVDGLGLETAGVEYDRGGIRVDERMRTNLPGVYAAGDVNGRSLLAHSAYRMAEVAVADIFGGRAGSRGADRMRYHAIPWVVFTTPEVAGCGMSEAAAREAGLDPVTAKLTMKASGRYLAEHPTERGFVKVVVDRSDRRLLGVHMIGTGSSEQIFGAAMAIEAELRVEDIREIIFPHPTSSEVLRDVMWEIDQ